MSNIKGNAIYDLIKSLDMYKNKEITISIAVDLLKDIEKKETNQYINKYDSVS